MRVRKLVETPDFDGATYRRENDHARLDSQLQRVKLLMLDGKWRTLAEIEEATGDGSSASISARLRDLRKEKFGGFEVERRPRGSEKRGLYEYRVVRRVFS